MTKNKKTLLNFIIIGLFLIFCSFNVAAALSQTWCKGLAFSTACFNGSTGTTTLTGVKVDWINILNAPTFTNGTNGMNGINGTNGVDGYTPIYGVDYINGTNGADGYTPIYGVDYINGTNGVNGINGTN